MRGGGTKFCAIPQMVVDGFWEGEGIFLTLCASPSTNRKSLIPSKIKFSNCLSSFTIIVGDSTVKHLHGKSITNKSSSDNIILVKPFPGARTKAMKHYVSPDLENKPDLVTVHTGTNDLKSVSSPEEIVNEII